MHVCSVASNSLQLHRFQPARLFCPWEFPGNSTGVGCHFLLQGIFPTQESNQSLLHCKQILYQLSYQGSPIEVLIYEFFTFLIHKSCVP